MNKQVVLTRNGETKTAIIRQMAHDVQAVAGKKFKYGSGAMWTVVSVTGDNPVKRHAENCAVLFGDWACTCEARG